jgi:ABC-type microcin C transport system permease subunit YejB
MGAYILRRLLLMIPTIIGIMAISFAVIQFAPGGPVEQVIAQLTGQGDSAASAYRAAVAMIRGLKPSSLAMMSHRSTAVPRALIRNSLPSSKPSSGSTSHRSSGSL